MAMSDTLNAGSSNPTWRDYLTLTKPRVVAVLIFFSLGRDLFLSTRLAPEELDFFC